MTDRATYLRTRKATLRAQRKCVDCRAALHPDDGTRCHKCRDRHRAAGRARWADPDVKAHERERRRMLRAERAAIGCCRHCGKAPAAQGVAWCDECRHRNKRYAILPAGRVPSLALAIRPPAAVVPMATIAIAIHAPRRPVRAAIVHPGPPPGWTLADDIREELLALSELVAMRKVS